MKNGEKTVLITGASRGIGAATALAFAASGARVVLLARDAAAVGALAGSIGPAARGLACDVQDLPALCAVVAEIGRVDVLVNNAAILGPMAPVTETDPEAWAATIAINLVGAFNAIRAVLPGMVAQGGGTILTLSSGAAHHAIEGWSAYCASKAGVAMLTESLHLEYAAKGIRAMGLSPGTVATDMQRAIRASGVGPVARLDWSAHIPPEWPARTLVWMCSPDADEFAGQEISLRDEAIRRRVGLIPA
jgi:NAD(P)-dependent dehydrogenase (short-subunit alcohol dehydrogenase family)